MTGELSTVTRHSAPLACRTPQPSLHYFGYGDATPGNDVDFFYIVAIICSYVFCNKGLLVSSLMILG